jgi:hypothetical protein
MISKYFAMTDSNIANLELSSGLEARNGAGGSSPSIRIYNKTENYHKQQIIELDNIAIEF